MLHPGWGGSHC